jgi:hypothetical protein
MRTLTEVPPSLRHNNLLTTVHPAFLLGQPMEVDCRVSRVTLLQYVLYVHGPRAPVYSGYADSDSGSNGR